MNIRPLTTPADWVDSMDDWAETHQKLSEAELDRFIADRLPLPTCSACVTRCSTPQACQQPEEAPATHTRQRRGIAVLAVVLGAVLCAVCIGGYLRVPA